jgi:hypothetical protein
MAKFNVLHFNPALVNSVEDVRQTVINALGPMGLDCRYFERYTRLSDLSGLLLTRTAAIEYAWKLIERAAPEIMGISKEAAKSTVAYFSAQTSVVDQEFRATCSGFKAEYDRLNTEYLNAETAAKVKGSVNSLPKPDPDYYDTDKIALSVEGIARIACHVATTFFLRVETETYVRSMELNYLDYRSVFTDSPCTHDIYHVLQRLTNPEYSLTDADRTRHFAINRAQSFTILVGMATFEVGTNVLMESDRPLAASNRYNSLKDMYSVAGETYGKVLDGEQPEEPIFPTVRLGKQLDDVIM